MISCKRCFKCNHFLPIIFFANNNVKFQLKTSKGKLFNCRFCTLSYNLKNKEVVRKVGDSFKIVNMNIFKAFKEFFKK